jgi:copper chaperone CopZ
MNRANGERMSVTTQYTVTGMTCGHCVQAVTDEISSLSGVEHVDVELTTGAVTITSDGEIVREKVAAAVDEAGYVLAP